MLSIRKIGVFGRAYRHFKRYRHIVFVLFKYGFGDLVDRLKIEHYIEVGLHLISRKPVDDVKKMTRVKRIRLIFEELGPTFVKLGQILSTRSDLISEEYCKELLELQDHVAPVSFEAVKKVIESEFRKPINELFIDFNETPIAAGSIGQVHVAQLKNLEKVAVKIQRPNIRQMIETDLEIMLHLASLLEKHIEEFEIHRPTRVVEEFADIIAQELDYTIEAAYIERFSRQFLNDRTIYVPKVYREETSEKVLTTEFIDGIKVSEIERLTEHGYDLEKIVKNCASLILKQVFIHGFFHGDPHQGNIFILPNNVICFLDFGITGRVNREERENFTDMTIQILRGDSKKAMECILKHTTCDCEPDKTKYEKELAILIDQHLYRSLKDLDMAKILRQLIILNTKHRLCFKPDLFLMMKALATAEILGRKLYPEFNLTEHAKPFIKQVQLSRLSPKRLADDFLNSGAEFIRFFRELPNELQDILNQARDGELRIEFEHEGLEPMMFSLDKITNRIVFAIVLAALIIGSSLIVLSGVPPKWYNIPIIGLSGFVIAGIMGFWLLWSILHHGKM